MIVTSEPSLMDGLRRGSANLCRTVDRDFVEGSGVADSMDWDVVDSSDDAEVIATVLQPLNQGKEEELKEEYPPHRCLGISNELVLNWIPEVDASDDDSDDASDDDSDTQGNEVGADSYLDDRGGKVIVNDKGERTHRVICSNGTLKSNYACESCGRRQTCCSKTFVPCCDNAFDEDVIHLVHPGSAGCDGAF